MNPLLFFEAERGPPGKMFDETDLEVFPPILQFKSFIFRLQFFYNTFVSDVLRFNYRPMHYIITERFL